MSQNVAEILKSLSAAQRHAADAALEAESKKNRPVAETFRGLEFRIGNEIIRMRGRLRVHGQEPFPN
jgi:hypothetical protein